MFASRINRLSSSLIREILSLAQDPRIISFAGGLPAAAAMPALDLTALPTGKSQYGATEGEPELRAEVARLVSAAGRPCEPDQVLITSGSQQGIDLVAKLFVEEGRRVLLESPSYLAALQAFRLFGADFLPVPLDARGVDLTAFGAAVAQHPAFAYLIPNFQNPAGVCYDSAKRAEVAALLDRYNVPLVEDEPYRELVYDPVNRSPICGRLERAPWIYLGTFSKTALPGLRIGYLACSRELFPYFVRLKQAADLHSNRIGQWWLAQYLSGDAYPRQLAQLRDHYRGQRDLMQAGLQRHFAELADWTPPAGGLFFWVRLRQRIDTRTLLPAAIARQVVFMPGEQFYPEAPEAAGTLRLNFSHASPEQIDRGLATLAEVVGEALVAA